MSAEDTSITWTRQEDGSYLSSDERATIIKGSSHWELTVPSSKFAKPDFETLTAAQEWYGNAPSPIGPNETQESNMPTRTRQRLGRIATALHEIDEEKFGDVISELQSLATHEGDLTSDEVQAYRQVAASVDMEEAEKLIRDAQAVVTRVADRLQNIVEGDVPEERIESRLYGDAFRLEKLLGQHPPRDEKAEEAEASSDSEEEIVEQVETDEDEADEDESSSDLAGVFDA